MTSLAQAERLFGLILPRDGYRACAVQWQPKDQEFPALYNRLFETDAELARWLAAKGIRTDVWFSTATFMAISDPAQSGGFKGRRDESNIHSRQCFHGDIDCGEDKPYPRFDHAQAALGLAVARLEVQNPIIVRSGHGLHFYWPLIEPVADIRLWRDYAAGLLAALEGQGIKLDTQCSTDPVRLLRPPGTCNHKNDAKLPVCVEDWGSAPAPLSTFDRFRLPEKGETSPHGAYSRHGSAGAYVVCNPTVIPGPAQGPGCGGAWGPGYGSYPWPRPIVVYPPACR